MLPQIWTGGGAEKLPSPKKPPRNILQTVNATVWRQNQTQKKVKYIVQIRSHAKDANKIEKKNFAQADFQQILAQKSSLPPPHGQTK